MARPLREIESSWTSEVKLYSNSTIECLERFDTADEMSARISGRSSRSGKWSWLARGSALEVVDPSTGQRLSACRFGWSTTKKLSYFISSVEEFAFSGGLYLIVGLRSTASALGMVCVFDPVLSRVIKAIELPRAVTCVECVTTSGGANAPQHAISGQLCLFFGVIAVGMECGHIYLVDLRLDDDMEEFDEWHPSHLQIVDPNANIAKMRTTARTDGAHLAFELGAECHMLGSFSYATPEGEILSNFSSSEISITSLKYIRQLGSLIVGYSFGCFQIWELQQHCREFSSSYGVYSLPVTHIVYQEPENDPRLCCYLWIARAQSSGEEIVETPTTITLYQVSYERKESLPGYGRVLKAFCGCGGRFEHQLTGDPYHLADATSCGSKVLCFYALERDAAAIDVVRLDESSHDNVTRDLTLVTCVWEAPAAELHSSPTCHLAVFDINRWYHSQMPPTIREAMYGSKDPTCPFFSVCSLAEVLDVGNPDALVDVLLRPNDIGRFSSVYGTFPEQFFWASSLTFDIICLMETGIIRSNFHGTQQQVLNELNRKGVTALSEAHDYFHRCWTASLMPKNFDFSRAQEKTFQVEALLCVALEHNQASFIISCINKLGEDNVTYAGCNLRIILEWAWDQVIQIKQHLDQLCIPLFDGTGIFVDKQLIAMLDHCSVQLGNLVDVFQALSSAAPTTDQGIKELESQYTVAYLLNQYLQVVLFFMKQRLLPELFDNNEDGELSSQYYPGEVLARQYGVRRRELEQLNTDSLGSLMIDRVVSMTTGDLGHNVWESERRWSEPYPAPNLHALSSLILQEKINPTSKLCIIYYSLLDLCSLNPQFRNKKVAEKFAVTFGLQPLLTNLFHGFWYLDHKDFENALKFLTRSAKDLSIAPWQNSHIIRLFLNQEEAKKAMLFIRSVKPAMKSPEDVELRLSVLINNGLVTEAFQFQRQCRDPIRRQQLLDHFFFGCHQTKNTSKVLELPFNKVEEDHLVRFLEESPFPQARELLVMFYLQRGFYVQAIRLNDQLKQDVMSERDPAAQRRASARNAIVEKYFELLPKVQQDLALRSEKSLKQKATRHREVPRPKPLSTVVNHKLLHTRLVSQSAVVNATLDKIAETRIDERESPKEAPFTGTPSTQRTKSLLSDSHRVSFPIKPQEDESTTEARNRPFHVSPQQSMMLSPLSTLLRKDRARRLFKGANALSLLQTPPVTKHLSFAATPHPPTAHRSTTTPHSILKPTRIDRRSPSPSIISPSLPPRVRRLSGERVPWMDGSDNEDPDVTTHKKQIRFKSPSPSSSNAPDSFSFAGASPNVHVRRSTVGRIPEEEDDVEGDDMETEAGSAAEESSESGLESDNEPGIEGSASDEVIRLNLSPEEDKAMDDKDIEEVVEVEDDSEKPQEMQPSMSDEPSKLDHPPVQEDETMVPISESDVQLLDVGDVDEDNRDQETKQPSPSDEPFQPDHPGDPDGSMVTGSDIDLEVFAVVDLHEDNDNEEEERSEAPLAFEDESTENADEVIRPTVVDPRAFMDSSLANQEETSTENHSPAIASEPSPAPSTSAVSEPVRPTPSSPARIPTVLLVRESPERSFMPLREATPVHSQSPTITLDPPPRHSPGYIDPGASTSRREDSLVFPPVELTSSETPKHEIRDASRDLSPDTRTQNLEASTASRVSPAGAETTPTSSRTTSLSTMTPPMSPPTKDPPSASGGTISPRIFLDDINSPDVTQRTSLRTPSQSERRQSRSPSRQTPTRTSPPLTRRRSSRLNTPHQSPSDSPISFVSPLRKSTSSPRGKAPGQKKPAHSVTHRMTLRARSCTNRTTRCAKLPHTH